MSLVLYTVGPATSRSLKDLRDIYLPCAQIYGEESGNGENLAHMILNHYSTHLATTTRTSTANTIPETKPALLFLAGEQHRDIIAKTLMSESQAPERRVHVDELVVYETRKLEGFENDFRTAIITGAKYLDEVYGSVQGVEQVGCGESPRAEQHDATTTVNSTGGDHAEDISGGRSVGDTMWVVVFSPTGCDAMLRVLRNTHTTGSHAANEDEVSAQGTGDGKRRNCFIATIGPTTRDHLRSKYGIEPEVCAEKPSPEGVGSGIINFMRQEQR
jgi:uroporphyrinogen-III synthase